MSDARKLVSGLRSGLKKAGNARRAAAMQAYMKSAMPFAGVSSPDRRAIGRALFHAHPLPNARIWKTTVLRLWREARFREERYFAIELALDKRYRDFLTLDALPMLEEMIVSGAWWDFVDGLASHGIGALLRDEPVKMRKILLGWARGRDMWKRRSAIISQLSFKLDTDLEFLDACIQPSLDSKEFFLRKAIGWALRQYAWTNPRAVERYVRQNRARLSALSVREALKNLG